MLNLSSPLTCADLRRQIVQRHQWGWGPQLVKSSKIFIITGTLRFNSFHKNMNHKHRGRLGVLLPPCTPRGSSPLPLVMPICSLTATTCCHLQSKAWPPHFCTTVDKAVGNEEAAVMKKKRNKGCGEQKRNMSRSLFRAEQVQPLFLWSKESGRTLSYSRSTTVQQIPKNLQVQDVDTQTASECYKTRRFTMMDISEIYFPIVRHTISEVCIPTQSLLQHCQILPVGLGNRFCHTWLSGRLGFSCELQVAGSCAILVGMQTEGLMASIAVVPLGLLQMQSVQNMKQSHQLCASHHLQKGL